MTLDVRSEQLGRRVRQEVSQDLDPRREGCGDVLVAAARQHPRAVLVRGACELGGEPCLADARFAADERDRAAVGARRLPLHAQRLALGITAGEGQLARDGEQQRRQRGPVADDRLPGHLVGDHRLGEPLELELADEAEGVLGRVRGPSPRTRSSTRICPPTARSQSRAAVTTGVP